MSTLYKNYMKRGEGLTHGDLANGKLAAMACAPPDAFSARREAPRGLDLWKVAKHGSVHALAKGAAGWGLGGARVACAATGRCSRLL